jgi:hypothetical protein
LPALIIGNTTFRIGRISRAGDLFRTADAVRKTSNDLFEILLLVFFLKNHVWSGVDDQQRMQVSLRKPISC